MIEFAIILPLLMLLLLGIIEFGWLFGQYNDVKHGAREGARFAAVDAGDNDAIKTTVCNAMEGLTAGMTAIRVRIVTDGGTRGSSGAIRVEADVSSLSGAPLITAFLPGTLSSEVTFRLEQPSDKWSTSTDLSC